MKLLCLSLLSALACYSHLYCEFQYVYTSAGLGLPAAAKSVVEKEITVKGTKDSLVRKQVVSETLYECVSPSNVIIKSQLQLGIKSNYIYTPQYKIIAINRVQAISQKPTSKTEFRYTADGKVALELLYTADGNIKDSVVVSYNHDNNAVIRHHYDNTGTQYKSEEQWYDTKGNEVKNIQQVEGTSTRIIYQYDTTTNNIVEERWYLNSQIVQHVYYEYANGLLISKIEHNESGEVAATTYYEYDPASKLLVTSTTGSNITQYEYNFDIHNNWIVKYEFYDSYPVKIIEREIQY